MMTEPGGSSFGALLKAFRKRQHRTQLQLAEAIGIHRRTLVRWEQGDYLPESKALVLELARHLKLNDQEMRELLEASLTALSPFWSVPLPRNPYFTGRGADLEALHAQLDVARAATTPQFSALYGLGGVGKTQIAVEYAYQHALEYSAVFWVGAETDEQIIASYLHIAEVLHLPEREEKDQQRMIAAVQRWLCTHEQWLLIWDNIEDLDVLNRFLPSTRSGAILMTTRRQALGTRARGLELLPMEQKEGMLFVLRRAKVVTPETTLEQMQHLAGQKSATYAAVRELVHVLGGLPLALDQAGAYLEETRCDLAGYLQRYQQRRHLLEYRGTPVSNHPHSVAVTFRLLLERVEREQRTAMDVLSVCAWLSADAIPEEVFLEGAAYMGVELASLATNPLQFDQIMAFLGSLSLVQRQAETRTFSLHRLVQAVLKEYLSEMTQCHWRTRVLQVLSQLFPSNERTHANYWQQCQRLLSHALLFLTPDQQEPEENTLLIPLMVHVANYYSERSCYPEAEHLFQKAIQLGEQAQGPSFPHLSEALHGFALLSWRQGNVVEAERLFQKVIQMFDQAGSDHSQVSETLYRLASLYRDQGKYTEAELLFQKAIQTAERTAGGDDLQVATLLHGLAVLYAEHWEFAQAEPLNQRALAIRTHILGPEHPQVAVLFHDQAEDYKEQGRYEEASSLFQQVLSIWEQTLGPNHPRVALPLIGLAEVTREQGRYEEASSLFQQALSIWEQTLGPDHPRVALPLIGLADLSLVQDQDEQAEAYYRRALDLGEQKLGAMDSSVASSLHGLAILSLKQANIGAAHPLFERALQIREYVFGHDHPRTADVIHDLALLESKRGCLDEALVQARRALGIRVKTLGDAHPKTVNTRALYVQLLQKLTEERKDSHTIQESTIESFNPLRERQQAETLNGARQDVSSCLTHDLFKEFLNTCCALHPRAWCRSADLWQAYQQWCRKMQERYPLSRRAFIVQLKAHGCRADRTMSARIWRGIALVKNEA